VCSCTTENINQFLQKLRDAIIYNVQAKRRTVALNLGIGSIWFNGNQTIEFKGSSSTDSQMDKDEVSSKLQDVESRFYNNRTVGASSSAVKNSNMKNIKS